MGHKSPQAGKCQSCCSEGIASIDPTSWSGSLHSDVLYSCSGDGSKKSHSQVTAFPISTFPALNIPRLCRRNLGMSRAEDAVDTALKGSAAHPTPHSCILSSSSSFPHCSVFSSGMEPSRKKPHSSLSPFQWCSEADAGCSECR